MSDSTEVSTDLGMHYELAWDVDPLSTSTKEESPTTSRLEAEADFTITVTNMAEDFLAEVDCSNLNVTVQYPYVPGIASRYSDAAKGRGPVMADSDPHRGDMKTLKPSRKLTCRYTVDYFEDTVDSAAAKNAAEQLGGVAPVVVHIDGQPGWAKPADLHAGEADKVTGSRPQDCGELYSQTAQGEPYCGTPPNETAPGN